MENWDEKKLEEVVNKKHGEAEKKKAKTQIVSLVLTSLCFAKCIVSNSFIDNWSIYTVLTPLSMF